MALGKEVGIDMNFQSIIPDEALFNSRLEDIAYLAYEDQCTPANPRLPLIPDMVVAPSISSQFHYAKLGQVITGIRALGFHSAIEAALGADMVSFGEAQELQEKKVLTSSCCPAFVKYIEEAFPELKDKISSNLSPMAAMAIMAWPSPSRIMAICR